MSTTGDPPDQPNRPTGKEREGEAWRPRRPSPLGLMGPQQNDIPKASGWPSLRAAGFMVLFMGAVVLISLIVSRSCR